jgi:hypothetical protein
MNPRVAYFKYLHLQFAGPLEVDEEICSALRDTGQFEDVGLDDDEVGIIVSLSHNAHN